MISTLDAAVNYVAMGWSVLPLHPNSKIPLIPWQEYRKRLPTEQELMSWFKDTKNNVGIVTGKLSNLSVVDVDIQTYFVLNGRASPITAMTRRGKHLYFAYSGENNSASKIAEHIDVRGEGGFVVASPSTIDGFRYRFVNPVIRPELLSAFPKELLESVNKSKGVINAKDSDWIQKALEGLSKGNRHPTFVSIIGRLHRDRHSSSTIYTFLRPYAESCGFDLNELQTVIEKVMQRYENNSHASGRPGESALLHAEDLQTEDVRSFLEGEENTEWIVSGVIAKSEFGFCAGLPETYKTWILADLAIECTRDRGNWLGMPVKKVKALFIDQERTKMETRRRFKKMLKAKGLTIFDIEGKLDIWSGTEIRINLEHSFNALKRKLKQLKPEIIFIDSFATFHTCGENDRQEIQKVLEKVKQLRNEFGCAIIFIDHENKSVLSQDNIGKTPDAFSMMGSVGKPAAGELVLTVRKESDTSVVIYNTKNSLAPAMPPITVQIVDTDNGGIRLERL